ncbi:MAG: M20/M25/M40 family metallo-hydrolase [Nitrospira sp.]|jgi:acetylornithine deacetylase/succinyl-diaminopimelate desuccinylase-like protein|nr:M20/M25/M40 family metallo-hydrolase [Nitrospira sp.]MDH4304879.1 M20/M25/M40 family metallo-hydrolase [Nitrospira sp.]MDH5194488.1 M20/M25/M40 family metallo-hydrolase [Nitrospira sp.]
MGHEQRLRAFIAETRPRFENLLGQMVEVPSISMDSSRVDDMRRMAELAKQYLDDLGANPQIVETGGYPLVSGGWTVGTQYPTVTIYNHLDVQPAQEPEWKQAPFAFRNDRGIYHGRGATDDKGPALAGLFGARYAIEQGVPINIRFLWELEEEIGSPHFRAGLKDRVAVPKPDSVIVSDTIWIAKGRPAVPYGLRGLLGARLVLRTGEKDAHSGVTGGAARNPLAELMEVATACVDARTGRVRIPGFYDEVVEPTKAEVKSFLKSGFRVKGFKDAYGFRSLRVQDPADVLRRIWASPTFEIHGLSGGYHGQGVKTIVPGHAELKVSMRLVPNQVPERVFALFKQYVAKINPTIKVEREGMLHPFMGDFTGPYVDCVKRAVKAGFGKEPAFVREGGSIGAVVTMQNMWKVPILFMGLSLPEHGYHAPNEYFDWGQASGGVKAFACYFEELARMGNG